jgi:cytochrome o ubiquinol oxidase subunit 1
MSHFDDPSLQIWFQIAAVGAGVVALGIGAFLMQLWVSWRNRAALRDVTGDPWNGRTLEWSTASPPPDYNFAITPHVHDNDAWHDMKQRGHERPTHGFKAIHMPKNTVAGVVIAGLATVCGFALIWHMWLLAGLSFAAVVAAAIIHTFNYHRDFHIEAGTVERTEQERTRALAAAA